MGGALSPAAFSALGYFVLEPNPRGSFGQGEAFTQANRKDFGYGDLRDILAGVDTVLAKYSVDPDRVGITGWSYGGFMTMFAVTQTHRFRAAVAGAGISDWLSYYGENSIDQWMIPYFGASVYDDPAVYAKSSAINFIKNVTTPTLVVVGDRDGECPAPQSFEFWHALRDQHVPTRVGGLSQRGPRFRRPRASPRRAGARRRLVCEVHAVTASEAATERGSKKKAVSLQLQYAAASWSWGFVRLFADAMSLRNLWKFPSPVPRSPAPCFFAPHPVARPVYSTELG